MESMLKVHVEFLDGRTPEDHEIPANYQPGQERGACMQLLAAINATGGVMEFDTNSIVLTPISSIKRLRIDAPSVVVAGASDLAAVAAAARAAEALNNKIKL